MHETPFHSDGSPFTAASTRIRLPFHFDYPLLAECRHPITGPALHDGCTVPALTDVRERAAQTPPEVAGTNDMGRFLADHRPAKEGWIAVTMVSHGRRRDDDDGGIAADPVT